MRTLQGSLIAVLFITTLAARGQHAEIDPAARTLVTGEVNDGYEIVTKLMEARVAQEQYLVIAAEKIMDDPKRNSLDDERLSNIFRLLRQVGTGSLDLYAKHLIFKYRYPVKALRQPQTAYPCLQNLLESGLSAGPDLIHILASKDDPEWVAVARYGLEWMGHRLNTIDVQGAATDQRGAKFAKMYLTWILPTMEEGIGKRRIESSIAYFDAKLKPDVAKKVP